MQVGESLGPDRFTIDFFHNCWHLVHEEVWILVEDSKRALRVLPSLNATFLILKEEHSWNPKQFKPVTLCNIIYKIITKVIYLFLTPLHPSIILVEQTGYVEVI